MINSFQGSVKGVTENVAKKVATVTFSVAVTDESRPVLEALGFLANKMPVTVVVTQSQMTMMTPPPTPPQNAKGAFGEGSHEEAKESA